MRIPNVQSQSSSTKKSSFVFIVVGCAIFLSFALYVLTTESDATHNSKTKIPSKVTRNHQQDSREEDEQHQDQYHQEESQISTSSVKSKNTANSKKQPKPVLNLNAKYKPKIHFITVQTDPTPGWCRNMLSAKKSGISVTSLGWQQKYSHVIRPSWIVSYINDQNLHPEDVILFADGSDTMFTGVDKETILKRFEYIAKTDFHGRRDFVMFNAEANCFHQQLFPKPWGVMKGRCISVYKAFDPDIRTKWRYLNAGAWIGTVRAATWWFSNASKIIKNDKKNFWWCDQSLMGGMMLRQTMKESDRSKFLAVLDTKNSIFLPTYHFRAKEDVCLGEQGQDEEESSHSSLFQHPPRLVLCHSRRAPAVLHFNGKSGNSGVEAERRVAFPSSKKNHDADDDDDMETIYTWDTKQKVSRSFKKMCPKF